MAVGELHPKKGIRQTFHHFAVNFDIPLVRHIITTNFPLS